MCSYWGRGEREGRRERGRLKNFVVYGELPKQEKIKVLSLNTLKVAAKRI